MFFLVTQKIKKAPYLKWVNYGNELQVGEFVLEVLYTFNCVSGHLLSRSNSIKFKAELFDWFEFKLVDNISMLTKILKQHVYND
jgi:hypothetical protein